MLRIFSRRYRRRPVEMARVERRTFVPGTGMLITTTIMSGLPGECRHYIAQQSLNGQHDLHLSR